LLVRLDQLADGTVFFANGDVPELVCVDFCLESLNPLTQLLLTLELILPLLELSQACLESICLNSLLLNYTFE
jgi:hypothetical protein